MTARLLFILAALFLAGCGASTSILPEPFTRERADGKIPVKTELIRAQVRAELSGIPEGEAEVARWQAIEADYHSCRLSSGKAEKAAEQVFADCMANRGYVYMYPVDAEQLHNDIAFEMEKNPEKWQNQIVTATIAASPITITNTLPPVISTINASTLSNGLTLDQPHVINRLTRENNISTESDSGGYAKYLLGIAAIGGIAAVASGGGGGGDGGSPTATPTPPQTTVQLSITITPHTTMTIRMTNNWILTAVNYFYTDCLLTSNGGFCREHNLTNVVTSRFLVSELTIHIRTIQQCEGIIINNVCAQRRERVIGDMTPVATPLVSFLTITQVLSPRRVTTRMTTFATMTATMTVTLGTNVASNIVNQISHSPDMRRVVHAVMTDGFNPGFAIGESGFAFSGRYDNDDRAAGFTYDFGNYALRTDYIRLPSKQDSAVWLDTYRFGALTPINDEVRFYAGVDSYNNAIFAIDAKGDTMHRLGFAVGDGYAVQYEYRLNL